MTKVGKYWIHNWLHYSDQVKAERVSPGLYSLSITGVTSHVTSGDIIVRWSKGGLRKTVWLVLESNKDFSNGASRIKVKDMIYWKLITAELKTAINQVLFSEELEDSIAY